MSKRQSTIHTRLLQDLANSLTTENFDTLKDHCKAEKYGGLGVGQLEKIKTLSQLFQKLQTKTIFNQGNYENLKSLLQDCGTYDAIKMVKTAEKELSEAGYHVEGYNKPDHAVQMVTPALPGKSSAGLDKADGFFSRLRRRKNEKPRKIFISFSFTMKERVTELKDVIEEYIGKDTCWICTTDIKGGDNLDGKIVEAIHNADVVLCMINKAYPDSTVCEKECILSFEKKKHMIPILLEKVGWPLVKADGEVSPMQLCFAGGLYVNMYDEDKMEGEFKRLIEQIEVQLEMQ